MPKLKCPSEDQINESLDRMWRSVDQEYVTSHIESAKWSNRSIEASKRYSRDARKRATPVLKWIKYLCQQAQLQHNVVSVHMIDHSKRPPEVSPYIEVDVYSSEAPWATLRVKLYQPKRFDDIGEKMNLAIKAVRSLIPVKP